MIRYGLGSLFAFVALNALGGGIYGMAGARGVPVEWLDGSPFADYFVPSLILAVVVGGSLLVAAIACFAGSRIARRAALGAAVVVLGWIAVQVAVIGWVSWLQPAVAVFGLLAIGLARRLPRGPQSRAAEAV